MIGFSSLQDSTFHIHISFLFFPSTRDVLVIVIVHDHSEWLVFFIILLSLLGNVDLIDGSLIRFDRDINMSFLLLDRLHCHNSSVFVFTNGHVGKEPLELFEEHQELIIFNNYILFRNFISDFFGVPESMFLVVIARLQLDQLHLIVIDQID